MMATDDDETVEKLTTKRILLTGSSGFLGQHVLHSLLTSAAAPPPAGVQYEIYATYASHDTFAEDVSKTKPHHQNRVVVHVTTLDLTKENDVKEWIAVHKPHVCLHMAAISAPGMAQENQELAYAVNCPKSFFQALADVGTQVIAMSTDQVYDGTCSDLLYVETDDAKPVNVYGQTKLAMEQALRDILPQSSSVSLRSSIICGPKAPYGNCKTTFLHFVQSRLGMETSFWTDEYRNIVSVYNVISILTWFLEHGIAVNQDGTAMTAGIYNMGGKDKVSRYDIALAVTRYFNGDESCVKGAQKASQPPGKVPSPLDISMDSSKIVKLTGVSLAGLEDIVKETFADDNK